MPPIDLEEIVFLVGIFLFAVALFGFALTRGPTPTCDKGFVMVKGMCVQGYNPREPR